ncbi:MAG: BrnA antitoxin family protein [Sedimentisphaerales bacterium]|nr:BrnA antitoxin family protein [Sedimentisphaerales bacterium]
MKEPRTSWPRLESMPDEEVDTSDIPELGEDFFREAKVRLPEGKRLVSLRIDSDILDWFKRQGKGYQTRINAVLRASVRAHTVTWTPLRRGEFSELGVDIGGVGGAVEFEGGVLVQVLEHQAPGGAVADAQLHRADGFGAELVVLVDHDRLVVLLQGSDALRDVFEGRAVEMDQDEVTRLGESVRHPAVTQAADGDQQVGHRLFRQLDQLDLAFGTAQDAMVEAAVIEFVGGFQYDVGETTRLDPLDRVDQPCLHGILIAQALVLSLVEAAQNDGDAVTVAGFDDPTDALEILRPQ